MIERDKQKNAEGLSKEELNAQQTSDLPDREAMTTILDLNADLDLALDLAAPIDAAVAANANVAAPIDAAVAAKKSVEPFAVGQVKNGPWTKEVAAKTALLSDDVNAAWRKLYERQAPLWNWPKPVADRIAEWGEAYPKVDPQEVTRFIEDYFREDAYPAFVDASDAEKITIPFAMLPSKDEDEEGIKKWQEAITVTNKVEWFRDQIHGWMAARGDLEDPNVKKDYERGYKLLLDFFHEHL